MVQYEKDNSLQCSAHLHLWNSPTCNGTSTKGFYLLFWSVHFIQLFLIIPPPTHWGGAALLLHLYKVQESPFDLSCGFEGPSDFFFRNLLPNAYSPSDVQVLLICPWIASSRGSTVNLLLHLLWQNQLDLIDCCFRSMICFVSPVGYMRPLIFVRLTIVPHWRLINSVNNVYQSLHSYD